MISRRRVLFPSARNMLEPMDTRRTRHIARAAAGVVFLLGAAALLGWLVGSEALKRIVPGLTAMVPNTALCFILAASALFIETTDAGHSIRAVGRGLAVIVATMGGLTLVEYTFGID